MTQLTGNARLQTQLGGKGYFADVTVVANVAAAEASSVSITFADSVEQQWREAAAVGLRIGWGCLPAKETQGKQFHVQVTSLAWMPADTTEVVVLHVAAKALLSLFDATPAGAPTFVPEFGAFLFSR